MLKDNTLKTWGKKISIGVALLLAGTTLAAVPVSARPGSRSRTKAAANRKSQVPKKPKAKHSAHRKTAQHTARAFARRRALTHRQLRARVHLESDRVGEIQQALVKAGYLDEEPTGRWDDSTRSAMKRYQSDHGFLATGLPEAKSLMKLGLGPHPLPPDLDPTVTARANADATAPPNGQAPQGNSPSSPPDNK